MAHTDLGWPGQEEEVVVTFRVHFQVVLERRQYVPILRQVALQEQHVQSGANDLRATHVTDSEHETRVAVTRAHNGGLTETRRGLASLVVSLLLIAI